MGGCRTGVHGMTQLIKQLGMKSRGSHSVNQSQLFLFFLVTVGALECFGMCHGVQGQSIGAHPRVSQTLSALDQPSNLVLVPGKAITGRLKKGETIAFDIVVPKPNQFLQVRVKQSGTDIGFVLRGQNGQVIAVADKSNSGLRERSLLEVLKEAGT